ncbi:MAG: NDP-sugar synthase [Actinomycetota bacterium]|nr:NDP-sugar synthase [Actinomycetota bacterium]
MRALILAGGLGTRLRPLTNTRPKHLLPIANRPHIEHVFDLLQRHDISEAVLLTSYLADAFEAPIAAAEARGFAVEVTHEAEPLGTAGALKHAEAFVDDETFLAFNGDILTDIDLDALIAFHRDRSAVGTIFLTPVEDPSRFGVVPTDERGRVEAFIEKPSAEDAPTNLINAGIYVLEPSVLDRIPAGDVYSAERQLFPQLVEDDAGLFALALDGYWLDIGTPASLLQANLDTLTGAYAPPGAGAVRADANIVDETAMVADDARLTSACLGAGVVVSAGASIAESVLLDRVDIGRGATVERSILGEGARVRPGAVVSERTIADGDEV